jgi:hypothetical protein
MSWDGGEAVVRSLLFDFHDINERNSGRSADRESLMRPELLSRNMNFKEVSVIGDVAYYYLPYVEMIAATGYDVRFVCMKRSRQATVESLIRGSEDRKKRWYRKARSSKNYWVEHRSNKWRSDNRWDKLFPILSHEDRPLVETTGLYWDYYYAEAARLEEVLPARFKVFPMENLNSEEGQRKILEFCGFDRVVKMEPVRKNEFRSK